MKIKTIETPRLYLWGFEKTDADFAASVWNDQEMGEYLSDEPMEAITDEYRALLESLGDDETCCYLISQSRETGERIGTCSFIPSEDGLACDIAYCVHKRFWRNGYATEMVTGMPDHIKERGTKKVTVSIFKDNDASNALIQKFGFVLVSECNKVKRGTDIVMVEYHYELAV